MARRTEQRFIIERVLKDGDLRDEVFAELTDLGWAKRLIHAGTMHEPYDQFVLRQGARIMARWPPERQ